MKKYITFLAAICMGLLSASALGYETANCSGTVYVCCNTTTVNSNTSTVGAGGTTSVKFYWFLDQNSTPCSTLLYNVETAYGGNTITVSATDDASCGPVSGVTGTCQYTGIAYPTPTTIGVNLNADTTQAATANQQRGGFVAPLLKFPSHLYVFAFLVDYEA